MKAAGERDCVCEDEQRENHDEKKTATAATFTADTRI